MTFFDEHQLTIKIIKSKLMDKYEIMGFLYTKLYTANPESNWLYSEIKGIIFSCVDYNKKVGKFMLFSEIDYSLLFEFEFYKDFSKSYTVFNPLFHYFEIGKGFIGFKFSDVKKADEFYKIVKGLNDKSIGLIASMKPTKKDFEIEENFTNVIKALKKKLEIEYLFKASPLTEKTALFSHNHIEKISQMLTFEGSNLVVKGSASDIEGLCDVVLDVTYKDKDNLKVGDSRAYALNIYNNIKNQIKGKSNEDEIIAKSSVYIASNVNKKVLLNPQVKVSVPINSNNSVPITKNSEIQISKNIDNGGSKQQPQVIEKEPIKNNVPVPVVTAPQVSKTSTPAVPNLNKVPNIPSVPVNLNQSKIVNNSKGVPKIPTNIPNIPAIPKIIPLSEIKVTQPIKEEVKVQTNEERLAEIQSKMGGLKKADCQVIGDVVVPGNTNFNEQSAKPKLSMLDELKLKMKGGGGGEAKKETPIDNGIKNSVTIQKEESVKNVEAIKQVDLTKKFEPPKKQEPIKTQPALNITLSKPTQIVNNNNNKVQETVQQVVTTPVQTTPSIKTNVPILNNQVNETPTSSDVKQDFKALMMQKFNKGGNTQNTQPTYNIQSNNTTSNVQNGGGTGLNVNPAFLNLPKKDPKTGKVIIDVPEGTKDSDRMDINKIINKVNQEKAKDVKVETKTNKKIEV